MFEWYEEGKIHRALANYMVRSKSEVIIANMLFERDIPFIYEMALYAQDGTMVLPDFTINWRGETWFWRKCYLFSVYGSPSRLLRGIYVLLALSLLLEYHCHNKQID
jgi:hypothetical protein